MPGDDWQKLANLRLLLGYMYALPGKKLLFMGGEFGVESEWDHESELAWGVLAEADHAGVQGWVRRLNELYVELPALHQADRDPEGFRWVVGDDDEQSVLAFVRQADDSDPVLVVANFTPVPRAGYGLGVPPAAEWELVANSDDVGYGGSGADVFASCVPDGEALHGFDQSIVVDIPPLSVMIYRRRADATTQPPNA